CERSVCELRQLRQDQLAELLQRRGWSARDPVRPVLPFLAFRAATRRSGPPYTVRMSSRAGLMLLAGALCLHSQTPTEIVALVRASIQAHEPDRTLAKTLHKIKPTERLEENIIEELQSEGAGPQSVGELERLHEMSEALPEPSSAPVFAHPPVP